MISIIRVNNLFYLNNYIIVSMSMNSLGVLGEQNTKNELDGIACTKICVSCLAS